MSGRPGPIGRARARAGLLGVVALAALAGVAVCGRTNLEPARDTRGDPLPPNPLQPPHPVPAHLPSGALLTRFAVIGDYGIDSEEEAKVARLVSNWNPDFVITTGDNNYPVGAAETIDANIGKYYWRFIGNYRGAYGQGSATNRFWPSPGNHDWDTGTLAPYLNYFTLPGNGRYYDTVVGPVHLFALDSDPREPDGTTADSIQGRWLKAALASSTSCHDIVYFHHPAYSSGPHGSSFDMRWPFEAWGANE